MARALRALPPATGELPDIGGVVLASPATPEAGSIEHAGRAYQELWREARGLVAGKEVDKARNTGTGAREDAGNQNGEPEESHASAHLKKMLAKDSEDLYGLLELGDKRWRATADDIKKAFRRISLLYHPDKVSHLGKEALENSETHFKKVKKAYDILADKKKRASYDSIDEVDDSIPSEASLNETNFFTKLRPVFDINARWSSSDRVPSLGDEAAEIDEVNKFYDFWYTFKTWRDFSFDLEYDTDQADCREEKRWMDRQNAKHIKTRKVDEAARIRRLVDTAYKNDPRIRRAKDELKQKKEAAKLERRREREAAEQVEQHRQKKEQEEEERRQAVDKVERARAKKDKDAVKKVTRRARQRLRSAALDCEVLAREDVLVLVERCCSDLAAHDIDSVAAQLEKCRSKDFDAAIAILASSLSSPTQSLPCNDDNTANYPSECGCPPESDASLDLSHTSSASKSPETSKASPPGPSSLPLESFVAKQTGNEKPWSHEEMKRLTKALSKFPPGTRDRYEKLSTFVSSRSSDSVLAMVNSMRAHKVSSTAAVKANGIGKSAVLHPVVADEGDDFERFQRDRKKGAVVPPPTYDTYQKPCSTIDVGNACHEAPVQKDSRKISSSPTSDKPPNLLAFSPKQQLQLEAAMKKYAASLGATRWDRIAADVNGRTGSECEKRYKELVEYYKAKKNAGK
jgi:DnaJ homolog subfamily C member 2